MPWSESEKSQVWISPPKSSVKSPCDRGPCFSKGAGRQRTLIKSDSDGARPPVITNSAEFFPSGISVVIQPRLRVISRGMIAGKVIGPFTFLGEAGSEVLPATQNGAQQKEGWPLQQTQRQQRAPPCSRAVPGMEAREGGCGSSRSCFC